MINFKKFLAEGLTITLDKSDSVETKLFDALNGMEDKTYADSIVRWYRNTKETDPAKARETVETGLANIIDAVKSFKETIKKAKIAHLTGSVQITNLKGQTRDIDIYSGMQDRYFTFEQGQKFMQEVAVKVKNETTSDDGSVEKYALTTGEYGSIKLLGSSENFSCWATEDYKITNKFVYHLWQNAETLGLGEVYGNPIGQTPYCTHSKEHWDAAAEKCDNPYRQFWFLKKVDGVEYTSGNLAVKSVREAFKAMRGKGAELLNCMTDTNGECLNQNDEFFWMSTYTDFKHADEIADLAKRLLDCEPVQKRQLDPIYPMLFEKGDGHTRETTKPLPDNAYSWSYVEIIRKQLNIDACDIFRNNGHEAYKKTIVSDSKIVAKFPEHLKDIDFGRGNLLGDVNSFEGLPAKAPLQFYIDGIDVEDFSGMPDCENTTRLSIQNCHSLKSFAGFKKIADRAIIEVSGRNLSSLDGAPSNVEFFEINYPSKIEKNVAAQYYYYLLFKRQPGVKQEADEFVKRHTNPETGNYAEAPIEQDLEKLKPAAEIALARLKKQYNCWFRGVNLNGRDACGLDGSYEITQKINQYYDEYQEYIGEQTGVKYNPYINVMAMNQAEADIMNGVSIEERTGKDLPDKKGVAEAMKSLSTLDYAVRMEYTPAYKCLFPDIYYKYEYGKEFSDLQGPADKTIKEQLEAVCEKTKKEVFGRRLEAITLDNCIETCRSLSERLDAFNEKLIAETGEYIAKSFGELFNANEFKAMLQKMRAYFEYEMDDELKLHDEYPEKFEEFFKALKLLEPQLEEKKRVRYLMYAISGLQKNPFDEEFADAIFENARRNLPPEMLEILDSDMRDMFIWFTCDVNNTLADKYKEERENIEYNIENAKNRKNRSEDPHEEASEW